MRTVTSAHLQRCGGFHNYPSQRWFANPSTCSIYSCGHGRGRVDKHPWVVVVCVSCRWRRCWSACWTCQRLWSCLHTASCLRSCRRPASTPPCGMWVAGRGRVSSPVPSPIPRSYVLTPGCLESGVQPVPTGCRQLSRAWAAQRFGSPCLEASHALAQASADPSCCTLNEGHLVFCSSKNCSASPAQHALNPCRRGLNFHPGPCSQM